MLAITSLVIIVAYSLNVSHTDGHQDEEVATSTPQTLFTYEELQELVYSSADKYGVSRNEMLNTVRCEAKTHLIDGVIMYDAVAQSDHYYKGVREDSWGLAQWNLPSGNNNFEGVDITKDQATNPTYALDLMADYFSKGVKRIWSCYRIHYG